VVTLVAGWFVWPAVVRYFVLMGNMPSVQFLNLGMYILDTFRFATLMAGSLHQKPQKVLQLSPRLECKLRLLELLSFNIPTEIYKCLIRVLVFYGAKQVLLDSAWTLHQNLTLQSEKICLQLWLAGRPYTKTKRLCCTAGCWLKLDLSIFWLTRHLKLKLAASQRLFSSSLADESR
jgi:hypothetical protein